MHLNIKENAIKRAQDLNGHFSKESIDVAMNYMERCSASVSIRELQLRRVMHYASQRSEWSEPKTYNNKFWKGYVRKRNLLPIGGNKSQYVHEGEQVMVH